jgi:hypothetical protein
MNLIIILSITWFSVALVFFLIGITQYTRSPRIKQFGLPLLILLFMASAATSRAQSSNTPPSIGDILSTGAGWIGNINTNYHFQNAIVWDGPIYENQVNVANELGASYDLWHSDTNSMTTNGILFGAIETRQRQAGIAGTWLSHGGGAEFGWQKCDFRGGLFIDGVYLDHPSSVGASSHLAGEVGLFADKMLSSASAVGIFVAGQSGQKYPIIGANLNVSFGSGGGFLGLFKH